MPKRNSKAKPKRLPGVGSSRMVRRTEPSLDSLEVVMVGDQIIPVLGVVNCTGKPLKEARETAKRIQAFCSPNDQAQARRATDK